MTPDKLAPVSEERLREIVTDADNFYRDEIKSMARECLSHRTEHITVPWTTIKQIMAAIRARSLTGDT